MENKKTTKKLSALQRTQEELAHLHVAKQVLEQRMDRLETETRVKFSAITQVSELFTTLRRILNNASAELAGAVSYTQEEISRMSADEYREKVLVPLNMGRRV
jgi:hypothetical protein